MAEVRAPAPASSSVASPRAGSRGISVTDRLGGGVKGALDMLLQRRAELRSDTRRDEDRETAAATRAEDVEFRNRGFEQDTINQNRDDFNAMLPFFTQFQQDNPGVPITADMLGGVDPAVMDRLNSMFQGAAGTGTRLAAEDLEDRAMTAAEHESGLETAAAGRAESGGRLDVLQEQVETSDITQAGLGARLDAGQANTEAGTEHLLSMTRSEKARAGIAEKQLEVFDIEHKKQMQMNDALIALNSQALEAGEREKAFDKIRMANSRTPEELILFDAQVAAMEDSFAQVGQTDPLTGEMYTTEDAMMAMDRFAQSVATMKSMAAGDPNFKGFLEAWKASGFEDVGPTEAPDSGGKSAMDLFKEGPVGAAGSIVRGEANTILGEGSVGAPATTTGEGNRFEIIR